MADATNGSVVADFAGPSTLMHPHPIGTGGGPGVGGHTNNYLRMSPNNLIKEIAAKQAAGTVGMTTACRYSNCGSPTQTCPTADSCTDRNARLARDRAVARGGLDSHQKQGEALLARSMRVKNRYHAHRQAVFQQDNTTIR